MYKQATANFDFPATEREILEYWKQQGIFERSTRLSAREIVFYDGPPFPTGAPHFGTIFVSILKDSLARYFTMAGYSVPRRWGWDCHGLPIENAVERKLNISDKTNIEKTLGVATFNKECRQLVADCNTAWEDYIHKIGRWVDYHNAYRTLDPKYMESVLWIFKQCYDKNLIYKDYRVTPYCYRCETSLSFSDIRESDSTRPRQDPEVVIRFKAQDAKYAKPTYYLAWTTTPWTLISNLALAVGANYRYAVVEHQDAVYIMAEALLPKWSAKLFGDQAHILETIAGHDLVGRRYEPIFHYYRNLGEQGYFRILPADFVTLDDGVGIVHCAPAFGEDDYWLCRKHGLGVRNPVDHKGAFSSEIAEFAGRNVHEANKDVMRLLKSAGTLLYQGTIEHNYPHCWRCRTPLIYRAMDAWYFAVEKIKPRLLERNKDINWVPDHVKHGRFGKWLEGARDWNISRSRYWGTPIPVWECADSGCAGRRVFGSRAELESVAGHAVEDLHKEFLDEITCFCPLCGGTMRRVPEVLDCWFESGAMPFGQCHYPFENKAWFESHFPADFIVEYPGQLRGWFYYLHVLAVALLDKASFKNCLVHGTLLAEDGAKISKSKKNFTDPMELIDHYGADAMRLYLLGSPAVVMEDMNFKDNGVREQIKQTLLPLWNAYSFFATYANIDGFVGDSAFHPQPEHALDRWILAVLHRTAREVAQAFSSFHLNRSLTPVTSFIEDLTNWYIRQSRARFWGGGMTPDKRQAYETLYYVLVTLLKLLAPSAPFVAEYIYRALTGADSVHLASWPNVPDVYRDDALIEETRTVRAIVTMGLALRQKAGIRVRQPLPAIQITLPQSLAHATALNQQTAILNELNVKNMQILDDPGQVAVLQATPNPRVLGPKFGCETQAIIKAAKAGQVRDTGDQIIVYDGTREWKIDRCDIEISYLGKDGANVLSDRGILLALDIRITPSLREEGIANELNRIIQDLRKKAGYAVSDKITLSIEGELEDSWRRRLAEMALAELAQISESTADANTSEIIEGRPFRIAIRRNA